MKTCSGEEKDLARFYSPGSVVVALLFTGYLLCTGGAHAPAKMEAPGAKGWAPPVTPKDADSDGDGLSDYAEIHKYGTDPHKRDTAGKGVSDSDWDQRKEFTYTITSVLRVLKPCNPAVMSDDYQDVRVLAQDKDSYTLEVVYYPLNTNRGAIAANPDWRKDDDTAMLQYLKPTPACNWDSQMQKDLIAQLKKDGIEPERLSDLELVEKVAHWAMERSSFAGAGDGMPISWFVTFPQGKPQILPELKASFDAERPDKSWTDQQMLDTQVLGKPMFYQKKHGACTSTSVYMATIFRALNIPTRIVYFIPPADGNDPAQVQMLLSAIHHHKVRDTVKKGLDKAQGFCNHMFNEVYVGKRWVRLNYDNVGQNTLDRWYFGLLTHIDTCRDIGESDLAQTWGLRSARYPNVTPHLSSINPYMLLRVSDHFGKYCRLPNPEVVSQEFRDVTVTEIHWSDEPGFAPNDIKFSPRTHLLLGIKESLPEESHPLRDFLGKAGGAFLLRSPGHADIPVKFSGETDDFGIPLPTGDVRYFHGFGVNLAPQDLEAAKSGGPFTLVPINTNPKYQWHTEGAVTLSKRVPLPVKLK